MPVVTPDPGISRQLARERASRVSNVAYELRVSVPRDREMSLDSALAITFTLADARTPLALDFAPNKAGRLMSCTANGQPVNANIEQGHIVLPSGGLVHGANRIELLFHAGSGPLSRREDHLYSIFVPARAHEAFPCFDQPDLRARFTLTLELPEGWTAVANSHVSQNGTAADGRTIFTFAATAPIPTYLFAFAAGLLLEDVVERDGRELRVYRTAADTAAYAAARDAIVKAHIDALEWLERYTGLPYPVRQVRLRARAVVPVWRHGTPGCRLLQCRFASAARIGHQPATARSRQCDCTRNRPHVVWRSRDDDLVR